MPSPEISSPLFTQNISILLDGKIRALRIKIPLLECIELDLARPEIDIPNDATIVYVNYTPEGSFFPLNFHDNEPFSSKIPGRFFIYGAPRPGTLPQEACPNILNIFITYVPHAKDNHNLKALARACSEYVNKSYEDMLTPAYAAIEDAAKRLCKNFFRGRQLKDKDPDRERLFSQFLPMILDSIDSPRIPDSLERLINGLTDLRNSITHKGKIDSSRLNSDNAAEYLCAAIFVARYLLALNDKHFSSSSD